MEKDSGQTGDDFSRDSEKVVERRAVLARLYHALPAYGSADFWDLLEGRSGEDQALPLEVLVMVLRKEVMARDDQQARRRIFAVIIARLQSSNEQWVNQVLASVHLLADERRAFAADLYADLCEQLLRSLLDLEQRFWEEAFHHCLRFARQHARERFLRREGYWQKGTPGPGYRVPHALLESLERAEWRVTFEGAWDVPDERAERAFRLVEQAEATSLLFHLPVRLRAIVWLIFWEDCSTKTVGELLGISDRTVRNRLRAALAQLRQVLVDEQEVMIDGASA